MVKPRWTADVRNIETCKWNKWSIVVNVILVNIRLKLTVIRGQKTNKVSVWSSQVSTYPITIIKIIIYTYSSSKKFRLN